nr:PilX N-terminal domain-containing pilus assembly protein [Spartinivicinus marinus]
MNISRKNILTTLAAKQEGAVLFVSLIILLVLSMIGISAANRSNIDAKISANYRDYNIAFQTAEKALIEAENYVNDDVVTLALFTDNGDNGLYSKNAINGSMWHEWENISTQALTTQQMESYEVNGMPEYYIENYATIKPDSAILNQDNYGEATVLGEIEVFRVTAKGVGSSPDSQVILQSMYAKQM